jgi:hypothetical protein
MLGLLYPFKATHVSAYPVVTWGRMCRSLIPARARVMTQRRVMLSLHAAPASTSGIPLSEPHRNVL